MNDFATPLAIPDVVLIRPSRHVDGRGFFSETFNAKRLAEAGISGPFVQDNHSLSAASGTVRGLHLQTAPSAQGKLVRVTRGAIWDVAVDVRHGSPNFGRHVATELSADNWQQLWIPPGFLHGFCTLAPNTEVVYKTTSLYDPNAERGALWNDASLGIPWPVDPSAAVLSDKDRALPPFASYRAWFPA